MSESMQHDSDLRVEAVGPVTWITDAGARERRVLLSTRGVVSMSMDDAAHLATQLLAAVRQAESV